MTPRRRALVVDDEPAGRRLTVKLLQEDFECVEAADGPEALDRLRREPFELVVSDVLMPGMDGFTLCWEVRHLFEPGRGPRFIFYTATHDDPSHQAVASRLGADAFLSRPATRDQLLKAIEAAFAAPPRSPESPAAVPQSSPTREYSEWLVQRLESRSAALKESEEKYRLLFDASNDGLLLVDGGTLETAEANRHAGDLFGCAIEALAGRRLDELCPEDQAPRLRASAAAGGGPPLELAFQRADGSTFTGELRLSRFELRGRPVALAVIRDVTEQKRLQEGLLQSDKMASVGLLIGGVAHELNNPLTAILGLSQLMLLEAHAESQTQKDLAVIEREAKRCTRLIKSLLAFARKQEHQLAEADLNELVTEILDLKSFDLRRSHIQITQELAKGLPSVRVDPHQIQQVLLNLLNNAEQAMEGMKGTVRVGTRQEGDAVVLAVTDSGPGIRPEHLAKIFDSFFTTKPAGKGTGLGLSICTEIAKEHGGELTVSSRPGEGAVFRLRLPVGRAGGKQPAPLRPGVNRRTLVVDDQPEVLQFMTRALRQAGWEVEPCSGAREALERLGSSSYDLVITDLKMPDLDGIGFYRQAVGIRPELARRFILVTAAQFAEEARAFAGPEEIPVLFKPFDLEEFDRTVRRIGLQPAPVVGGRES